MEVSLAKVLAVFDYVPFSYCDQDHEVLFVKRGGAVVDIYALPSLNCVDRMILGSELEGLSQARFERICGRWLLDQDLLGGDGYLHETLRDLVVREDFLSVFESLDPLWNDETAGVIEEWFHWEAKYHGFRTDFPDFLPSNVKPLFWWQSSYGSDWAAFFRDAGALGFEGANDTRLESSQVARFFYREREKEDE